MFRTAGYLLEFMAFHLLFQIQKLELGKKRKKVLCSVRSGEVLEQDVMLLHKRQHKDGRVVQMMLKGK